MQNIVTCLWFDGKAKEAVDFYLSVFKDAKKGETQYYTEDTFGRKEGEVLTIEFELRNQKFLALNAGPEFKFNESVSFIIHCDTQEEIDYYWAALTANGGEESQCGWLKDPYGVSWQITPTILPKLLAKDPETSKRVFAVVKNSVKLDIAQLEAAAKQ